MTIAERLADVRARIRTACDLAQRDPAGVRLIAVSKLHPAEAIREAHAAGQRDFGENYVQELADKAEALADLVDLRWHLIGHLQSNKAKVVARVAHVVHSVDSAAIALALGQRAKLAGRTLEVLAQVSLAGEAQKSGCAATELDEVLQTIGSSPSLRLRGLMTMPPLGRDPEAARPIFASLRTLRNLHGGEARLPELSMGMSDDLAIAVSEGATMVRVGTAIFGARA